MFKIFLILFFSMNLNANILYRTCFINELKTNISKDNFIQDLQKLMKNYGFKRIILMHKHTLDIHIDKTIALIYRQKNNTDKFLHIVGDIKFAGIKYPTNAIFVSMNQMKIDLWAHLQEMLNDNCEVKVLEMK